MEIPITYLDIAGALKPDDTVNIDTPHKAISKVCYKGLPTYLPT